jgi:RNA polymerase sigma-70 factor (ECF subfamily)
VPSTPQEITQLLIDWRNGDQAALDKLMPLVYGDLDPRKSRIVELRYFGGTSVEEMGKVPDVSATTIKQEWRKARGWLYRELRRGSYDA